MQKKMKIGYVSLYSAPDGGGAEIYVQRMIKALDNFDHYLWTTISNEKSVERSFGENCSIEEFGPFPKIDLEIMTGWFIENREEIFKSIRSWAKKTQCDFLLFNSPFNYFDQVGQFFDSLRADRPIGCLQHNIPGQSFSALLNDYQKTESWEDSLRNVRPQLLEFSKGKNNAVPASPFSLETDFTIYNSEWMKEFYDPYEQKESFIFHPLISRTHDLPELGLKPVDLTIVNPLPMKGGVLFLALANFHFRKHKIRILEGGYNSSMDKLKPFLYTVRSGLFHGELPENVEVLGYIQNMSEVYRNTKILLHPTRIESYGMTAAEALFEDAQVVTSDIPGVIEGVGDAAISMPYYATPQEWADVISPLLKGDHPPSEKISQRAAFIRNRQAEEIEGLKRFFETIVSRRG